MLLLIIGAPLLLLAIGVAVLAMRNERQQRLRTDAAVRERLAIEEAGEELSFLNSFVDHLAGLWTTDPSRREVWLAMQSTPSTRATGAIHEREFAEQVARMLAPLTPDTPRPRRKLMAEVLVHIVYSMLNFSVQDDQTHADAVVELKRIMVAYLQIAEQDSRAQAKRRKRREESARADLQEADTDQAEEAPAPSA